MSPASAAGEVRAASMRLRAAGAALRARSRGELVSVLGALLDRLRDPRSEIRARLAAELPRATGFHPATLAAGLDAGVAPWTARALAQLVEHELGSNPARVASGFPLTAVVLAGTIPMPSVLQLLAPLAVGSPVMARPGANDPVTARAVASELALLDSGLAAALEIVSFAHSDAEAMDALCEADCVVATGSDDAVLAIRSRTRPCQRFVGYGHRFSVAALGRQEELAESCAALSRDVLAWDQLGCLSPIALFAVGWSWRNRRPILDELASAFAIQNRAWPRGALPASDRARRAQEIATSELRAAAREDVEVRLDPAGGWALLAEREPSFRGSPLGRTLRVHFVPDARAVEASLAPVAHHLASAGLGALSAPEQDDLTGRLTTLGASRVCRLGEMQAPPLSWAHDGQGVLIPLVRITDLALES